jgi:hypothetical protein
MARRWPSQNASHPAQRQKTCLGSSQRRRAPINMIRITAIWLALSSALVLISAGCTSSIQQTDQSTQMPRTPPIYGRFTLSYSSGCICGALISIEGLEANPGTNRFSLRIRIENLNRDGSLDFSSAKVSAYPINGIRSDKLSAAVSTENEAEVRRILAETTAWSPYRPPPRFSHFSDLVSSDAPLIEPGASWDGLMTYFGILGEDTVGLVILIERIESPTGSATWRSSWTGAPMIMLQR